MIVLSLNRGEKLVGADDKLLFLALQHQRRFAGGERRAALNLVRPAFERHLRPGLEWFQPQVILLCVDLFHGLVNNTSVRELKPPARILGKREFDFNPSQDYSRAQWE